MKKYLYLKSFLAVMLALLLAGCANTQEQTPPAGDITSASQGTTAPDPAPEGPDDSAEADTPAGAESSSVVYMTTDISPEGLMAAYEALGWEPEGKAAVKLSTGEPPASNYLDPNLIKDVV